MSERKDGKRVVFRRIHGRVIPILVGSGLVAMADPFTRDLSGSSVKVTRLPFSKQHSFSFRPKGELFPRAGGLMSFSPQEASLDFIYSQQKGAGKKVARAMSGVAKTKGYKSLESMPIRTDAFKFLKKSGSIYKKNTANEVVRRVNLKKAMALVASYQASKTNSVVTATTEIPSTIKRVFIKPMALTKKALIGVGVGLISFGFLRKGKSIER